MENKSTKIVISVVIILIFLGGIYYFSTKKQNTTIPPQSNLETASDRLIRMEQDAKEIFSHGESLTNNCTSDTGMAMSWTIPDGFSKMNTNTCVFEKNYENLNVKLTIFKIDAPQENQNYNFDLVSDYGNGTYKNRNFVDEKNNQLSFITKKIHKNIEYFEFGGGDSGININNFIIPSYGYNKWLAITFSVDAQAYFTEDSTNLAKLQAEFEQDKATLINSMIVVDEPVE